MGIHNFQQWIRNYFPEIQETNSYSLFDYIYIDLNFFLHTSIFNYLKTNHSNEFNEEDFKNKLYFYLDLIFKNFFAKKEIFISMDGPAPLAKILLQRQRRMGLSVDEINALHLTPGTLFQKKVISFVQEYIEKLKKQFNFLNPKIILCDSDSPDEGEIKINSRLISNNKLNFDYSHLVIGNDSDIIVLCMACVDIRNIFILFKNKKDFKLLSIFNLIQQLRKKTQLENDVLNRLDFVFISLMLGNDYLPKINYVNINNIFSTYFNIVNKFQKNIFIQKKKINYKILEFFIFNLFENMLPRFQKKFLENYNEKNIKKYYRGLFWCLEMYETGKCSKYDFMIDEKIKSSIHPLNIYCYLIESYGNDKKKIIKIPRSNFPPLNSDICCLILLNTKSKNLIDEKKRYLLDDSNRTDKKYLLKRINYLNCVLNKNNIE